MKKRVEKKRMFAKVQKRKFWDIDFLKSKKRKGLDDKKKRLKKVKKSRSSDSDDDEEVDTLNLPTLDMEMTQESIERDGNHVYYYSEVNRDSIFKLNMLIKEAEEENLIASIKYGLPPIPIYLHINSFGGSVYAAFAAIDVIQACRVPVHTICEGAIASAGTLISVVGVKRYMRPSAYLLIHQLSSSFWGKMAEIEDEFVNLKALMKKIKSIYRKHCNIPKKELSEILKHDLWWDYEKCLEMGLVDGLWPKGQEEMVEGDDE
jgi:ATP-dependent Clp endopeptidase proteolytic subunit ClpP